MPRTKKSEQPKTIEVKARSVNDDLDAVVIPTVAETVNTPTSTKKNTSIISLDPTGKVDLSQYTPAEIEKYKSLSNGLKTTDSNSILNYGVEVQNKLAAHSDTFLSNVRAFDTGEIGNTINDLLSEINYIDIDPTSKPAWQRMLMQIPFLKGLVMNTKKIFQKYDTVSNNVNTIVTKLDKGRNSILKDNNMLESLFTQNVEFIYNLEELIVGGHIKLQEMEAELKEMEMNAENYEDYEIADKRDFINRLSKRLHDMEITRMVTLQSLPQIRLVQNNNVTMAEKVQSSINTTIPIWKNQLTLAVTLMRQQKMAEIQNKVTETTNTLLTKNAEMLKTNSVDIAKQNERAVVDIETLRKVQDNLLQTIDEIKRIKTEGEQARKLAAKELESLEQNLKNKVQQIK
ncbi:MAG: toxic anion resistance protein [Spirochaetes bacterium]|nr:MAG: toxic anion resistance protein [Spirochaetota bacterium]